MRLELRYSATPFNGEVLHRKVIRIRTLARTCMTDPNTRKHDADGNPVPLSAIESQIEYIHNATNRDGTYKGYAILTFTGAEAAALAVEALKREGYFNAKFDKDQSPESPVARHLESVRLQVRIGRIPQNFSRHYFTELLEECIPR